MMAVNALAPSPSPSPVALGTRARPLAVYIVSMHRRIHPLFTDQFLAGFDARHELDDPQLSTQLEIVVRADGSLDRVTIVRSSGAPGLDVAAVDSVTHAAPFDPVPAAIRSADGKLHLTWKFHRDAVLGCATLGVDPR